MTSCGPISIADLGGSNSICVQGEAKYSGRMGVSGTKKAVEIEGFLEDDTVAGLNAFE